MYKCWKNNFFFVILYVEIALSRIEPLINSGDVLNLQLLFSFLKVHVFFTLKLVLFVKK